MTKIISPTPNPFFEEQLKDFKKFDIEVADIKPIFNLKDLSAGNYYSAQEQFRIDTNSFVSHKINSVTSITITEDDSETFNNRKGLYDKIELLKELNKDYDDENNIISLLLGRAEYSNLRDRYKTASILIRAAEEIIKLKGIKNE
jgi:hypothetical protein